MLIKKYKKDEGNKEVCLYKSSNILASEYDINAQELTIVFLRGAKYIYKDVYDTDYVEFQTAKSQGKVLNNTIIPKYPVERQEDVDPDQYQREVENTVREEIKKLETGLSEVLEENLKEYKEQGTFSRQELDRIISIAQTIKDYEQS